MQGKTKLESEFQTFAYRHKGISSVTLHLEVETMKEAFQLLRELVQNWKLWKLEQITPKMEKILLIREASVIELVEKGTVKIKTDKDRDFQIETIDFKGNDAKSEKEKKE